MNEKVPQTDRCCVHWFVEPNSDILVATLYLATYLVDRSDIGNKFETDHKQNIIQLIQFKTFLKYFIPVNINILNHIHIQFMNKFYSQNSGVQDEREPWWDFASQSPESRGTISKDVPYRNEKLRAYQPDSETNLEKVWW
jgi:hypothetical protein